MTLDARTAIDVRLGYVPVPAPGPGYAPAGDAAALRAPQLTSPAVQPVPGVQYTGSYAPGQRFVIRVPEAWNGRLVVAGTPATRCEFANDFIWGEIALAGGYAFASSNKGVPYNATFEPAASVADPRAAYPIPFDLGGCVQNAMAFAFGALTPERIGIERWNDDYRALVIFARALLAERHHAPERVYAVGTSNGGAQVRTLLERSPELVDGGVEWAGVYWTPERNLLDDLPAFLAEMPAYIAGGCRDRDVVARLVARGFPPDVWQDDPVHPSLYAEYYSNTAPFYADVSVFLYALLLDPHASSSYDVPPCSVNADDPIRLPATVRGTGLASPQARAAYVPSDAARDAIARFAHTGALGKPLVSIAGTHDAFITPARHGVAYAEAVAAAGCSALHALYLVDGGTHVDTFVGFGYGMQAQAPFAWAAFEKLVRTVERGDMRDGGIRTVTRPGQIG